MQAKYYYYYYYRVLWQNRDTLYAWVAYRLILSNQQNWADS